MRRKLPLFVLLILTTHTSFAAFSHSRRGQEVCRTEKGKSDNCYPTAGALFDFIDEDIDIVAILKLARDLQATTSTKLSTTDAVSVAASGTLSREQIDHVLRNYDRLLVRNLALSLEADESQGGEIKIPLLATVDFINKKQDKFTVHFEGYFRFDSETMLTIDINNPNSIRTALGETMRMEALSEVPDEPGGEDVHQTRAAVRKEHFEIMSAKVLTDVEIDAATFREVNEIVAPVTFSRLVYGQVLSRLGNDSDDQTPFTLEPKR